MTEERRALVVGERRRGAAMFAYCYGCRTLLATRGADVRLADGLVPRPAKEPSTGLPRFGPPRERRGHEPREAKDFLVNASTRAIGNPGAIYVNCPACDRGQAVRWP
jgi:hypothetical protein